VEARVVATFVPDFVALVCTWVCNNSFVVTLEINEFASKFGEKSEAFLREGTIEISLGAIEEICGKGILIIFSLTGFTVIEFSNFEI